MTTNNAAHLAHAARLEAQARRADADAAIRLALWLADGRRVLVLESTK